MRNGLTECWHHGASAVSTPEGRLVARIGDAGQAAFLRSAAKPFQALPLLRAGGRGAFDLEPADLALICASHTGTPEQVGRARRLLDKGGFSPDDLLCGAHEPFDEGSARRLAEQGESPGSLHNRCSGKHAGMLLACRLLGYPTVDYLAPEHPLQQSFVRLVAVFACLSPGAVEIATDGCSAPTYRLPLSAAARAYAALAAPGQAGVGDQRQQELHWIVEGMTGAPEMVAGPGQFTTRLMEVTRGRVVAKEGANGYYAMAIRGPAALGVALKIADGSDACRDGVVLEILRQLGSLSAIELEELASFYRKPVRTHLGAAVGEMVPVVELQTLDSAAALIPSTVHD